AKASAERRRRAGRAAAGSSRRSPPTATPRRRATYRSPPRRACAYAAGSPARPARRSIFERLPSRPADRDEVQRAIEIGLRGWAQREVRDGDRGREPVVEAFAQAEPPVRGVPADSQGELVRAE